jgi:hypothetical protein
MAGTSDLPLPGQPPLVVAANVKSSSGIQQKPRNENSNPIPRTPRSVTDFPWNNVEAFGKVTEGME